MLKGDVLKIFQKIAKGVGYDLSLEQVNELIKVFDDTIVETANKLEKKSNDKYDTANLGCVTITKKERKGRKDSSELGGKIVDWETPDKEIISLKLKKSVEKDTSVEL